ncbi:MAG: MFS transporter [Rhodospirillales bacterium]|nr:MFS transporter [Rhodospirillales bacterium]MBT4038903.1 MFS transporter [Rhodospirillales bacterium]MBT4625238.1 MFS transporter [Rhodospirillales bacterium]MBT5351034.1 MFS transporter [Rhodospirillales bacterium]MBT5521279.1 MFS transporter [Rhodospirillales bacterium]
MLTLSTFPSLIPVFQDAWGLSNTEAGTISGLFFAGELISVTLLSAMMDRWDGRPIFLIGLFVGCLSGIGFLIATGFWSAGAWRFLQGFALGATYMPGLKILTDHLPPEYRSRGTSFYTATYYLAAGFSYFLALETEPLFGWQTSFLLASLGPFVGLMVAWKTIPSSPPPPQEGNTPVKVFDFSGALKNRKAIGFSLLYGLHNMELIAFSSWLVPFLAYSQTLQPSASSGSGWSLGIIAAFVSTAALPASIFFNEITHRVGRQALIVAVAVVSVTVAITFAYSPTWGYTAVVLLAFVFSMSIAADSSAITGGVLSVIDPAHKGRSMSLYSLVGFTGAFIGPVIFGMVLDGFGGEHDPLAWIAAFAAIAGLVLIGPIIVWRMIGFSEKIY